MGILDEAKNTLEEIVRADGTAIEGYDYQEAADTLMNTMQELIEAELEYQDLFAVPLLKLRYPFYGIIFFGIDVELVGQAGVVATFGVTVTAEYGQKIGFNYNFLKAKGGSYKEKLASEVTTEIYLIGKIGVRVGIAVTLSVSILHKVTVSITGSVYAYVELAGMFMYTYALSAGGGNYAGALYLEVGIDIEIELGLEVEVFLIAYEKNWTLWSHRWPLYSVSRGMTMSVVQTSELKDMWAVAASDSDIKTSFTIPYIPMKTYDMLTASCTENQLLFENLQKGNVTAKLTLENIVINGEPVSSDDPRTGVLYVGDGENGKLGVVYVDELAAAANKVTNYDCDVVLTYENKNKSELIKRHRQVFPLSREFKMATTIVNVDIALYDWCAHAWGIEEAEWDNDVVFETNFENTHVLGCPVEPSATGMIDLDFVIAAVKEQYPEIDGAALSWFNPTLNQVNRTVQYSIPRISNMCYLTPESDTVRYDIFATTTEYDLTFNLFASRYPGYTGEITYIIEAPEMPAGVVFTVSGSDEAETMTFAPMEGEENRWSLTTDRSSFNGSERAIMMSLNGGNAVASGLTVTGREDESVVVLTLSDLSSALTVEYGEGIATWEIVSHNPSEMSAITPGEKVTLSVGLKAGYEGLRLTSEPAGLEYSVNGRYITFTMPSHDVTVTLQGVRYYQANFLYNYGDLGTYRSVDVEKGTRIRKPSDPFVEGLTFAGWYDNAACEGEPFNFDRWMFSDITLYADWRVNVTVDLGGAQGQALYVADRRYDEIDGEKVDIIDSKLVFPGDESEFTQFTYATQKLGETALEIILPNYDGYDFMGWYLTADFSDESVEPVDPTEYVLTEGVTFYARWEKIAVLTYELNYGEQEEPYAMILEHVGLPVENIPEDPQRQHYEFLGWFRTQDGGESNRVSLDSYLVEDTMTLYASWKPVEYSIIYELNGGENASGNPVSHNIESERLSLFAPFREGYRFLGWDVSGIDALESDRDGGLYIPAGSVGEITLTANWEPIIYSISIDLIRGETAEPNPSEYTIESEDIVLVNPTAEGYEFIGWTGTDLTEPTLTVVIPAGSVGDRSYQAKWLTNDPVGRIVAMALDVIPDSHTMNLSDFTGIQDIETLAMELLAADEKCADYIDQLSVAVDQLYDPDQDGNSHLYTLKITVSFTDDSGATTSDSKEMELTVLKNPVTISAEPVYTVGGSYIPYGTSLSDVELTGTATCNGETVTGSFAWEETNLVARSANNGLEVYKVVFTPDDTDNYSTADILIAVDTQIGLQLRLNVVPDSIEYMGRKLDVNSSTECGFYVTDADTGARIDGVTLSVTGAVLEQSRLTPGTANVYLTEVSGCTITGDFDPNLYAVVGTTGMDNGDTVTIIRATPVLSGTTEYNAALGSNLSSIAIQMTARSAYQSTVAGSFAWETPSIRLNTAGSFTYKVVFTPSETSNYTTSTIQVTVNVSKQKVVIPTINSVTYNGTLQKPSLSDTTYYTVESNNGGTDAGDYTVTLKLRDAANYLWADGDESATKNLTFTIEKAALRVSSGYSVTPLGYGQQLVGGKDIQTDKRYKSASDIIKNANVTIASNGTAVAGWWEWTDENYVGKILNASSTTDNADYGDGYQVIATFHPTSLDEKNFETLEQQFLVEIARATPDFTNCGPYIKEGDIYMPSDNDPVARLSYFTPVMTKNPINPNTDQPVAGTLKWVADSIPQVTTTKANAKFVPSDPKNYNSGREVEVPLTYKDKLTVHFVSGDPFLYKIVAWNPGPTNNADRTWDPVGDGRIQFIIVLNDDTMGKICPYRFTVTDSKGNKILQTSFPDFDPYTREPKMVSDLIGPAVMKTAPGVAATDGSYGYYYLTLPGDKYSLWNCTDINVYVQFGSIDDSGWKNVWGGNVYYEGFTSYEQYCSGGSSYSLLNRSLAPTTTIEQEVESTTEPTEEPTTIPVPGEIGDVVSIQPKQEAQQYDDLWVIPLEQDQQTVEFRWEVSEPASEYLVYTLDEFGNPELIAQTTDSSVCLPVEDYEDGCITLYVGAVLEDGSVTWGEAQFELIPFVEEIDEPIVEPTEEPAIEPTEEPTEEPAVELTEEPTEEPAVEPTEEPTEEPAVEPTEESTEEPAVELTEEPAEEPAVEPTEEVTTEPTDEPMPEPSPEPTPEPVPEPAPEPVQEPQTADKAA
ncbi:MAG: InlB B-repeat-containing protein [Firmicutes bacterium]|nr:InlB B-repeat-containing protein [Bacillota bacterium]